MTDRELLQTFMDAIAPAVVEQYGADQVALGEAFNDWTDSLQRDGQITARQYNEVCMPDLTDRQFIALLEGQEVML